jgi:hypothetical protein
MENWKAIPGYEGRYEVSDQGRVRSVDRRVRLVAQGVETTRFAKGQILRPGPCTDGGHLTVAIGKGNSMPVHLLVMLAFEGPRPDGADVAHGDGNPTNNRFGNLRYATRGDNNRDVVFHGRRRLTVEQIRRVRAEARGFRGAKKALALEFKVSTSTISDVLAGRSYSHVN